MSATTGDPYVDELLTSNGLEDYLDKFRYHAVRSDVLFDLTHQDLLDIGVKSLGHRIRLLKLASSTRSSSLRNNYTAGKDQSHVKLPNAQENNGNSKTQKQLEETIASLQQQLEETNKHQVEQIAKLRTWFSRKLKEMAPLPTPNGSSTSRLKTVSPMSTNQDSYFTHMVPSSHSTHNLHKRSARSPQTAQFSPAARLSPTTPLSPPALPPSRSSIVLQQYSHNGTMILGSQNDTHNKSMKVSPEDRTPKVLAAALYTFMDVKDAANWRLCFHCRSVDKLYELKDDQHPQRVYRELMEQGMEPVLVMNHVPLARQSQPNML